MGLGALGLYHLPLPALGTPTCIPDLHITAHHSHHDCSTRPPAVHSLPAPDHASTPYQQHTPAGHASTPHQHTSPTRSPFLSFTPGLPPYAGGPHKAFCWAWCACTCTPCRACRSPHHLCSSIAHDTRSAMTGSHGGVARLACPALLFLHPLTGFDCLTRFALPLSSGLACSDPPQLASASVLRCSVV